MSMKSAISGALLAGTQAGLHHGSRIFPFRRPYPSMRKRSGGIPTGTTFARTGSLEVRLARNPFEIRAAQHLRYQVFYEEMAAVPDAMTLVTKRDQDSFDRICDHLLVLDHGETNGAKQKRPFIKKPKVVGTYRLLRQEMAEEFSGFYTQDEFDIAPLIESHGPETRFVELGRSCVLREYRTRPTIEMLWRGIWAYVVSHGLDVMIGCASLQGTNPVRLADQLSFLYHYSKPPSEWQASAHREHKVEMNIVPMENINRKEVLRSLPPLIKGYLRAGAYVGDGAVIDYQFATTDVLMIMPVSAIKQRYIKHFGQTGANSQLENIA